MRGLAHSGRTLVLDGKSWAERARRTGADFRIFMADALLDDDS